VDIKWYSGSIAEERPRAIVSDPDVLDIDEIIDESRIYDTATTGFVRRLIVRCGKRIFRLRKEFDQWQISEEYDT